VTEGDKGIFYLNGSKKLGGLIADDFEAQAGPIAGVHVGDYAFRHFAESVAASRPRHACLRMLLLVFPLR